MSTHRLIMICATLLSVAFTAELHAQSSAFTYQGFLTENGAPANGTNDFEFRLYDAATAGGQVGPTLGASSTEVTNGLFTVQLPFGAGAFDGSDRWLNIAVRPGGSLDPFTSLVPRQQITSAPYAIRAATASAVNAANVTGTLGTAQLPATVVTNGASGLNLSGTFIGDGASVTNVNLLYANSQGAITFATNFSFGLSTSHPVGLSPVAVATADVNRDGWVDLISVNIGIFGAEEDTLSVLTNNGSGGLTLSSSPGVSGSPFCVTAADVNGDDWVDLISASSLGNHLIVLTNDHSGTFVLSGTPAVGTRPVAVTTADVNDDGEVDVITANITAGTLSVLTNNGSGAFVLSATLAVGAAPRSIASADVNGDGWVDLISGNSGSSTLTVLTNNGTGGFLLSSSPGVGGSPYALTVADVSGDGLVDLISADHNAAGLTVLTNDGSGGFPLSSSPSVGGSPRGVTAADINGDGHLDLISANLADNTLTALTNDGGGGFTLYASLTVGSAPAAVTTADVDGDGWVDVISANEGSHNLTVIHNAAVLTASFSGDGSGLTGLSLSVTNLTGALDAAQIPDLDASKITTGTLAEARLSTNVALLNRSAQTFTGTNIFASRVGIGTSAPKQGLHNAGDYYGKGHLWLTANQGDGLSGTSFIQARDDSGTSSIAMRLRTQNAGGIVEAVHISTNGNVGIGTVTPTNKLDVAGNVSGTTFITTSDRNAKENFNSISPADVLAKVAALPISEWNFKTEARTTHIGPMAQDFYAAFGVGPDDTHIATVDADGVALAAIQGLNQKTEDRSQKSEARIQKLEAENAELKQRLAALEKLMKRLSGVRNGGEE